MASLFEIKLAANETDSGLELAEITQPPGVATPLHRHTNEAEVFYILDGKVDYEAGGTLHHLETGSTIYLPANVAHRFRIVGEAPARILAIVNPGGLFDLYRQVGLPAETRSMPLDPDPSEFDRWNRVAPGFGLEVLGPPLD